MKLMICTSRVPFPLDKGDKLRAYNQIKELSKNHEIHLCCLNDESLHPSAYTELKKYCKAVHVFKLKRFTILFQLFLSVFSKLPLHVAYFYNRRHKKSIQKIHDSINPDAVFCQLIRMAPYVLGLNAYKIIDLMDVFSVGIKRRAKTSGLLMKPIFHYESSKLKRFENYCIGKFNASSIISEADKKMLSMENKDAVRVIPNGVDFDFFKKPSDFPPKKYDLVFVGNMSYAPNILAAEFLVNEILPELWKHKPEANLLLAGTTPDKKVKALASDKITVSGFIEDIRDAYNSAHIFIAPMQIGTGLQNKLLEAMALEIPCITSPLAAKGIKADHDSLKTAKTKSEYIQHILSLMDNDKEREAQIESALSFVHQQYHWTEICKDLDKMLQG